MKKIFIALFITSVFTVTANAQQAVATTTQEAKAPMSKEEKAKAKQQQEDQMNATFKEIGLTDEQVKQIKEVMTVASKKSSEIKKDASLTDDAKKESLKVISTEKNEKIKEIMGKEKYKQYNEIRKKQKEAANTSAQ